MAKAKLVNPDGNDEDEILTVEQGGDTLVESTNVPKGAVKAIGEITSPFVNHKGLLYIRPRKGWHQTWKRGDECIAARESGYEYVKRPVIAKDGTCDPVGKETGDIIQIREDKESALYAMECPIALYNQHLAFVSARSHMRYSDQADVMSEYAAGMNRDLGSRREQLSIKTTFEEEPEQLSNKR